MIDGAQTRLAGALPIHLLDGVGMLPEKGRARVVGAERRQWVMVQEGSLISIVFTGSKIAALHLDRNRQPCRPLRRLDQVPIPPIPSRVLRIVEQHELVDAVDQIEIALPGDVAGLDDGDALPGHARADSISRERRFLARGNNSPIPPSTRDMADFLKSIPRWLQAGWLLPLVLLALPNCTVDAIGTGPAPFDPGPAPRTEAVMCDIPQIPPPGWNECATAAEIGFGIPLKAAATALAQSQSNSLALDYSPAATSACGGSPKKIEFHGPFPDGLTVCLNCGAQIPSTYDDPQAVCVAKCIDLVIDNHEPEEAVAFCEANAKVSTNINNVCFTNACSNGGTPLMPFEDPRRPQEKVQWIHVLGNAQAAGPDLSKVGGVDNATFDSGAASNQAIPQGDAWIEFEVTENDKSHVIGLRDRYRSPTPTRASRISPSRSA